MSKNQGIQFLLDDILWHVTIISFVYVNLVGPFALLAASLAVRIVRILLYGTFVRVGDNFLTSQILGAWYEQYGGTVRTSEKK